MNLNRISNGGFSGDLANWTAVGSAAFVANQGNQELGAAYLSGAGQSIWQDFAVALGRPQMVNVYGKAAGSGTVTVTITDDAGNTVYTANKAVTTSWADAVGERIGLPQGNYRLTLAYNDVAVYLDDISIAWVIKTRTELAGEAEALLGALATADADYSTAGDGDETEGDYTNAVDSALRQLGAVDEAGRPDVRCLTEDTVDACVDEVQRYMLHKLHRYYARNATDFTLEGRTEHYQQRVAAIEKLLGIAVGGRPPSSGRAVQSRQLIHKSSL